MTIGIAVSHERDHTYTRFKVTIKYVGYNKSEKLFKGAAFHESIFNVFYMYLFAA